MRNINDIESFGGTAAEDDDIRKFFLKTPAFNAIWNGKRCVITGRKGSGKTALYLAIQNEAHDNGILCRALSFSDYPWSAHKAYASGDSNNPEQYAQTWKFFLLVQILIALTKTNIAPTTNEASRALADVNKFLKHNYGSTNYDFKKLFPEGGVSLTSIGISVMPAQATSGQVSFEKRSADLGKHLSRLNEWMENKLISISSTHIPNSFILFDELDWGFDPNNRDYTQRISGLLIATRRFVQWAKRNKIPAYPVVFLRSDIFDSLHFGDLNKIHEANRLDLRWHDSLQDKTGESLKALIDFRIRESLDLPASVQDAWGTAFESSLMRGTQHKFQHITFRTFLRPRDVIKFCNTALEEAQRKGSSKSDLPLIDNSDITRARQAYSLYFLRELNDEISEAHKDWEEVLKILREIGRVKFTMEDFEKQYDILSQDSQFHTSSQEMLNLLYNFSIIGFEKATGSGVTHLFKYQNETLNFNIRAKSFRVHRGLKEALGLIETSPANETPKDPLTEVSME